MKYSDYSYNLILRVCHVFFHPNLKDSIKNPPSLFKCIIIFLKNFLISLVQLDFKKPGAKKIVFFSTTVNNNRALEPIWSKLNKQDYVLWLSDDIFSNFSIKIYSFLYFFPFIKLYFSLKKEEKLVIRKYSYWFMNAYGYYKTIDNYLSQTKKLISLIVLANDHSPINRCIIENCHKYNIKTLYIQHANIDTSFPPNTFTYSFLDGLESYKKYLAINGIRGKIFLSGSSRFDSLVLNGNHEKIGVALNELDNISKVLELCNFLVKKGLSNLIIRPHPALVLSNEESKLINELGISISDSKHEDPFDFIAKLKILIANESGIHLEAALGGVPSIQYNFSDLEFRDVYSFVKNGIVRYCDTFDMVYKECKNPILISKNKVRDFNAATGTKWAGKVSEIIAGFINTVINDEDLDLYISQFFANKNNVYTYKNEN